MGKIMQGEKKLCSIEKGSPALGVAAREGSGGASPEEGWGRKGTRAPRTPPPTEGPFPPVYLEEGWLLLSLLSAMPSPARLPAHSPHWN